MKNKIIATVMAVTMVFGGAVCPLASVVGSTTITASADELVSGNFKYRYLNDGTIAIYKYLGSEAEVVIPDTIEGKNVTTLWDNAFYMNKAIKKVVIGNNVRDIGSRVFSFCESLSDLTIGDNVTRIYVSAFAGCKSLETVKLPAGLKELGDYAFSGCSNLKTIDLGNEITILPQQCFRGCEKLENVKLPQKLYRIDNSCFESCTSLKELKLPDGIWWLRECMVNKTKDLTIEIPANATNIEQYTFVGAENLTIKGYAGSYIEKFAKDNGIKFVLIGNDAKKNGKLGDVNLDGSINVADIAMIASHIKGIKALTGDSLKAADVNGDGNVNVADIAMIASHIKGIKALS